jgi:hypothetical protein
VVSKSSTGKNRTNQELLARMSSLAVPSEMQRARTTIESQID